VPVEHQELGYDHVGRVDSLDILGQDYAAWTAQGPIVDRTREHPVTSDQGVILFHNLLLENVEKVARGEDPLFTIRDEGENTPFVQIPRERVSWEGRRLELATS
jgi:5,5'-dehydrodivanillate O-demethylase